MTHLRKMMLEELQRRNYSEKYHTLLHSHSRGFCSTLQLFPGSLRSSIYSRISSGAIREARVVSG
jgi:hypothetical protein